MHTFVDEAFLFFGTTSNAGSRIFELLQLVEASDQPLKSRLDVCVCVFISNDDNQHRCASAHEHPKLKFENI